MGNVSSCCHKTKSNKTRVRDDPKPRNNNQDGIGVIYPTRHTEENKFNDEEVHQNQLVLSKNIFSANNSKEKSLFNLADEFQIDKHMSPRGGRMSSRKTLLNDDSNASNENSLLKLTKELSTTLKRINEDINRDARDGSDIEENPDEVPVVSRMSKYMVPHKNDSLPYFKTNHFNSIGKLHMRMVSQQPNSVQASKDSRIVGSAKKNQELHSERKMHSKITSMIHENTAKISKNSSVNWHKASVTASNMKHISVISLSASIMKYTKPSNRNQLDSNTVQAVENSLQDFEVVTAGKGEGFFDSVLHKNIGFLNNRILNESINEDDENYESQNPLLVSSSQISGVRVGIWRNKFHNFDVKSQGDLIFRDEDFKFDIEQLNTKEKVYFWKRMYQKESTTIISSDIGDRASKIMQGKPGTCSVITALICMANYEAASGVKIIESMIFPQKNGVPIPNASGRYIVRMSINGTKRAVEIDDSFPFFRFKDQSTLKEYLYSSYSKNENEIWVALAEKAILKVYGCDFKKLSSIPSIEVYHLCGWVPENIIINEVSNLENLWSRLIQNFDENNIMISLGSRDYNPEQDKDVLRLSEHNFYDNKVGLIFSHTYSVLQLKEIAGVKILKVQNPWGLTPLKMFREHSFDADALSQIYQSIDYDPNDVSINEGVSLILWDDVVKYFSDVYLSWNPFVYPFKKTLHSSWINHDKEGLYKPFKHSLEECPQFLIRIPPHDEDFEVRVCVDKHVKRLGQDTEHITYQLFSFNGDRIIYPIDSLRSHPYYNREILSDVFIFEASKEAESYVLILQKDSTKARPEDRNDQFSVAVFSFLEVDIIELPFRKISHAAHFTDQFTDANIGGNILSPKFLDNPAYVLQVTRTADFHLQAEGPPGASIMIMVVPSSGIDLSSQMVSRVPFQNFLKYNPDFYYEEYSSYKIKLQPGVFIIYVSNQNRVRGPFRFSVVSYTEKIHYRKMEFDREVTPPFSAHEYMERRFSHRLLLTSEWTVKNSKGSSRPKTLQYQSFFKNPGYIIKVQQPTQCIFHLQSLRYTHEYEELYLESYEKTYSLEPCSLCVSIYRIVGFNKFECILENETYAPSAWGSYSEMLLLEPDPLGYLVVCINSQKGYVGELTLNIWSDKKLESVEDSKSLIKKTYNYTLRGVWSKENSGGSLSEDSFYKNPQYEISTKESGEVFIELVCSQSHLLSLCLFESAGKALTEFNTTVLSNVVTNQVLVPESTHLCLTVKPNSTYLLVPATHRPMQVGKFAIKISSDVEIETHVKQLQTLNFSKLLQGEFTARNNKGAIEFEDALSQEFMENPHIFVKPQQPTTVRVHLSTPNTKSSIAIHCFEIESEQFGLLENSGPYSNFTMGCFLTMDLPVNKGGYLFIFSVFESDFRGTFFVELSTINNGDIKYEVSF